LIVGGPEKVLRKPFSVPAVSPVSLHECLHVLDAGVRLDVVRSAENIAAVGLDYVGDFLNLLADLVHRAERHRPLDRDPPVEAEHLAKLCLQLG